MNEQSKYLVDVSSSGRVRPWRKLKVNSLTVAESLTRLGATGDEWLADRAVRMSVCSSHLQFSQVVSTETGEVSKRLTAANFCRDRLCPMCQWRKSLVMFSQISRIMDRLDITHPGLKPIFLTLTVRNCTSDALEATLKRLIKAWSNMFNKRGNTKAYRVVKGWFRAIEITYNPRDNTWHPHMHAILLVEQSYFSKDSRDYLPQDYWIQLFKRAAKLDYDPSVDIRRVRGIKAKAVAEVAKYSVKPGKWLSGNSAATDGRVSTLAYSLHGKHLIAFGGLMRTTKRELKLEDVENADLVNTDESLRPEIVELIFNYRWQAGVSNYVLIS